MIDFVEALARVREKLSTRRPKRLHGCRPKNRRTANLSLGFRNLRDWQGGLVSFEPETRLNESLFNRDFLEIGGAGEGNTA